MSIPTRGETYAQLTEHLRKAQEACAMMAHLHNTEDNKVDRLLARGWLGMEELMKRIVHQVVELAKGRLQ